MHILQFEVASVKFFQCSLCRKEQRRLEFFFTLPRPDTQLRIASAPNSPKAVQLPLADGTKNNWNSDTVLSSLIEQLDLVRLDWRPLENTRW